MRPFQKVPVSSLITAVIYDIIGTQCIDRPPWPRPASHGPPSTDSSEGPFQSCCVSSPCLVWDCLWTLLPVPGSAQPVQTLGSCVVVARTLSILCLPSVRLNGWWKADLGWPTAGNWDEAQADEAGQMWDNQAWVVHWLGTGLGDENMGSLSSLVRWERGQTAPGPYWGGWGLRASPRKLQRQEGC